jgi:hypothetical protein
MIVAPGGKRVCTVDYSVEDAAATSARPRESMPSRKHALAKAGPGPSAFLYLPPPHDTQGDPLPAHRLDSPESGIYNAARSSGPHCAGLAAPR